MPFDAGMFAASCDEIRRVALGARIDRIHQPEKEEIVLVFHDNVRPDGKKYTGVRLAINAGTNNAKIALTHTPKENPAIPPMLCIQLRKQLSSGRLDAVEQLGFERAMMLTFSCKDEMGFPCTRYIVAEMMGKYSNLILLDDDKKILTAMKLIDFATSKVRQVLPGMRYENPPAQEGKIDPLTVTEQEFCSMAARDPEQLAHKWLITHFFGLSPLLSREIAYLASGSVDSTVANCGEKLGTAFFDYVKRIGEKKFTPFIVTDEAGKPIEFSFMPIRQYGDGYRTSEMPDFGALCDRFFDERDRAERVKQKAGDLLHIIGNAKTRLSRKIVKLTEELEACDGCESYRREADLITSNIYLLKKGMDKVRVTDYYSDGCPETEITLDVRLTPAQNAQAKYKKYNKYKKAKGYLSEQIALAESDLRYIETVQESLSRSDGEADLAEIREELSAEGFASHQKTVQKGKKHLPKPLEYRSTSGYRILCGKNNIQNDYITLRAAGKGDIWFHAKNRPGSHVVLFCDGEEPSAADYTDAAMIAAYHSQAGDGGSVEVDYTRVKNIKKPVGAKPGFVIYHTNYSTLASRDADAVSRMLKKN